jgi:hypothetical protein
MVLPYSSSDRVLNIYLSLTQYPILASRIRARMRAELFLRGIITPDAFEADVREKAIRSQEREGLHNPFFEEAFDVWETRLERVRDSLTDFYFAYNLPYDEFENIVRATIGERGEPPNFITFNPELAPQDMLFEQAEMIERLPTEKRKHLDARLQEIKVVLIRTMISDHLSYVNIAKKWFTVSDLKEIRRRKIGYGKIGGKSAGMMLAHRILSEIAPPEIKSAIRIPVSYFLGSDVFYTFMSANGLIHWADQKYKPEHQIRSEYETIQAEFLRGKFPRDILDLLRIILEEASGQPLIVRSSSLLEDNFGTSFAGKYDSFFCPNQGNMEENLKALSEAIIRVYASALNPDALLYRHHKGLVDYDERIAILIQFVEGEHFGRYYLPHGAGVAFSRNLYRWSPQIKRDDGFLRIVWGMGTRAVDTIGNDHPRLVALSHPLLHPAAATKMIRRYSQQYVDLIDLEENKLKTLPVSEILNPRYPPLRYIAQVDEGDYLTSIRTSTADINQMVITFDELLRRTPFAEMMKKSLKLLEEHYRSPVDTEFTVKVVEPLSLQPKVEITLLQCRPQSAIADLEARLPEDIDPKNIIFATRRMVPRGSVYGIRYVLFVTPEGYFSLPSQAERSRLERAISELNKLLKSDGFICVGPGRWGTSTPDLGVHVVYGDIYNTRALVEISGKGVGTAPEPSFGTHFFQDLMEAHIYPLAVYLDDPDAVFNQEFFNDSPNHLADFISPEGSLLNCLRLIDVEDFRPGSRISLIMDDEQGRAAAFLQKKPINKIKDE